MCCHHGKRQADSWSRIGLDIDPHEHKSLFPDKGASQIRCKKQVSMWGYRLRLHLGCKEMGGASLLSPNTFLWGAFACKGLIKNNRRESSPKQCPQSAPIHYLLCSSRRQHKVIYILENVHSLPMIVIQTHQNQIRKKGEKVTRPEPSEHIYLFFLKPGS